MKKPSSWIIGLVAGLLLCGTGAGAYFLITKNAEPQYIKTFTAPLPVPPSTSPEPIVQPPHIPATIDAIQNALIPYTPYLDGTNYRIIEEQLTLKDGVTPFTYCLHGDDNALCLNPTPQHGTLTISNITPSSKPELAMKGDVFVEGTLIYTVELEHGETLHFVSVYDTYKGDSDATRLDLYGAKNLNLQDSAIEKLELTDTTEIRLTVRSTSGVETQKTYAILESRGITLAELTTDRTKKIFEDDRIGYTLEYPERMSMVPGNSWYRNLEMEDRLKQSPIYFDGDCGLQPVFASTINWLSLHEPIDATSTAEYLTVNLAARKIAPGNVYITSSQFGYDPADWGVIKKTVVLQNYADALEKGALVPGKNITIEKINGYTVRHLIPISQNKECSYQGREQYQWVSGGLLFNMSFMATGKELSPFLSGEKEALISSIFSSLKVQ